jgi:hypothetical protein
MDIGTDIFRFACTHMDTEIGKFLNVYTPWAQQRVNTFIWAWSCASAYGMVRLHVSPGIEPGYIVFPSHKK